MTVETAEGGKSDANAKRSIGSFAKKGHDGYSEYRGMGSKGGLPFKGTDANILTWSEW